MRRLLLTLAVLAVLSCVPLESVRIHASQSVPFVASEILDASGATVTGTTLASGSTIHITARVGSSGAAPTGTVTFPHFASVDCTGLVTGDSPAPLETQSLVVPHIADISNAAGWDNATAWNANGTDQFDTNWFGSLFAGSDNGFFNSSSMAWRFTNVPVGSRDRIDSAYLSLRIQKSRPSLPSEQTQTWKAVLAADTQSGSDFQGETRTTFLQRFGLRGPLWETSLSPDVPDPFGTNDGALYASSPDFAGLIQARTADPSVDALCALQILRAKRQATTHSRRNSCLSASIADHAGAVSRTQHRALDGTAGAAYRWVR